MKRLLSMRPKKLVTGAKLILLLGLPVIAAELIYIAYSLSNYSSYDTARLGLYIHSMLDHVLMSLTLIVGGALLFDIAKRKADRENQD